MVHVGIPALAKALSDVAREAHATESKADRVLAIVKRSGIRDLKAFDLAVREAYKANGWYQARGKPKAGVSGIRVPATVKQYVSGIRAAFRYSVPVANVRSFYELRQKVKAKRPRLTVESTDPKMAGLRLVKGDTLIGAPFHDLAVLYQGAGTRQRSVIAAEVRTMVEKFRPAARPELKIAA